MKEIKKITQTFYEVGMSCSNRTMYGIRDNIKNMVSSVEEDLYDISFSSYSDYEGDLEGIIFYYDKENHNHRLVWELICKEYKINLNYDLDYNIHFTIF